MKRGIQLSKYLIFINNISSSNTTHMYLLLFCVYSKRLHTYIHTGT